MALIAQLAHIARSTSRSTPHHGDHRMSATESHRRLGLICQGYGRRATWSIWTIPPFFVDRGEDAVPSGPEPQQIRRPARERLLWVPETYATRRYSWITPPARSRRRRRKRVQVSDATWQRTKRRGLVQGAMWPVRVVEVLVLAQDGHQVALVPDQGPVQQLTPAAANPAFHDRVHPGTWTAERRTLAPAAWKTASNATVKLASRSCRTNFTLIPASSRSISRFLACCTTHDWTGCPVAPRIRIRRVPCSITART